MITARALALAVRAWPLRRRPASDRTRARQIAGAWLLALAGALILALPSPAAAGDIEDFQAAAAAYQAHDWPRAVLYFEALVGTDPPALRTQLLVLESRKYLAAAYVFVGRTDAARAQFERLLVSEPDYQLDTTQFPIAVVELFEAVRREVEDERRRAAERAAQAAAIEAERDRSRALVALLEEEVTVELANSRWLALVPFGAGQFQNGQDDLGWMFLSIEAIAAAGTFASLAVYTYGVSLLTPTGAIMSDRLRDQANDIIQATSIANVAGAGLFLVFAISGIVQAQLDFRPTQTVRTRREVPPELREGLELSVTPNGFRLSF